MAVCNAYVYANLHNVAELGENTRLCLYEPSRKLYVVKTVSRGSAVFYRRLLTVEHPSLAKILFVNDEGDTVSVVREYLSGDSLADLLKNGKTLPETTAVRIALQVCEGLAVLHANGLVHRDINPNNILLTSDGNVKIIDYGIARSFSQNKQTDTEILGTVGYAAPEQFGFAQSDAKTDLYAVGVLLNVMLTGDFPNKRIAGGALGEIVQKCTRVDAAGRYATADQLADALRDPVSGNGSFRKRIPGLRSRYLLVRALSVLGYLFAMLFVAADFCSIDKGAVGYLVAAVYWCFLLVIPFFCFSNFLNVWDKLPFSVGTPRREQKTIYRALGGFSIFFGLLVLAYGYSSV